MRPTLLTLTNFRNYAELEFVFPSNLVMLVGENGSGKTNFLEALSLLGSTRSFRTKRHFDLVRWGEDLGAASLKFEDGGSVKQLGILLDRVKKVRQFRKNRQPLPILSFLGLFSVVLFAPDDTLMVTGAPRLRRQFLDLALSQCSGDYFRSVTEFQRVLRHRNTLLSNIRDGVSTTEELPFWDERLCSLGAEVTVARLQLLRELHTTLSEYYSRLSGATSHCSIEYRPSFSFPVEQLYTTEDLEQLLRERLVQEQSREIRYGRTLLGPHLDDLRFFLLIKLHECPALLLLVILVLRLNLLDFRLKILHLLLCNELLF